jgi:hypothetical protein
MVLVSSSREAADGTVADAIRSGDIGLRLARREALKRFLALEVRELWRPTEQDAALLRALAPFTGTGTDQFTLELG